MTKSDILLLYQYDRWANDITLEAAAKLTHEEFTRDLGGSFRSVRDTLVHILGGEWIWLTYWNDPRESSAVLAAIRTRRDALFHPEILSKFAAVEAKWREVKRQQLNYLDSLTEDDLAKLFPFRSTSIPLVHLMQHMANHSTYHRGQISLMMRQLGAEPRATDFHLFYAETHL